MKLIIQVVPNIGIRHRYYADEETLAEIRQLLHVITHTQCKVSIDLYDVPEPNPDYCWGAGSGTSYKPIADLALCMRNDVQQLTYLG